MRVCLAIIIAFAFSGCASMRSLFGVHSTSGAISAPIQNPFGEIYSGPNEKKQNIILRTKKGDRAIEVELPSGDQAMTDFVVPVSPAFSQDGRSPASIESGLDETYRQQQPSITDREIASTFSRGNSEYEGKRREVEEGMGVIPAEDSTPENDTSYLAGLDRIKQLYRLARYEAALLEIDQLLHSYQTSAKLYQMKGTVLDRLGYIDLALKSWQQALHLDPNNQSLRAFLERKQLGGGRAP